MNNFIKHELGFGSSWVAGREDQGHQRSRLPPELWGQEWVRGWGWGQDSS